MWLGIPIEDLGGKELLAHVGRWLFAVEYLNLWHIVQVSLNCPLLHLLILLLDSFLCLGVERALRLQDLDFNLLRDASEVLVATTNFTFADASPTFEEAGIAWSLKDRCSNDHMLGLMLFLDGFECSST